MFNEIEFTTLNLRPVVSSQIHSIGHDPATETLGVCFKNKDGSPGAVWAYRDVSALQFQEMEQAPSPGGWFARNIKAAPDLHPGERLDEPQAEPEEELAEQRDDDAPEDRDDPHQDDERIPMGVRNGMNGTPYG